MRGFDFFLVTNNPDLGRRTLLVTLIGMGITLIMMMTLQQRRERQNRQINGKALIAAYKVLGGSFTGTLAVSPLHLRDLRRAAEAEDAETPGDASG